MRITRRDVFVSGAATAAAALTPKATFGGWEPSERYPDPAVKVLDPSFAKYNQRTANVERLYTGARWSEGPVWFGDARCLLWSDIPNDRILRWDEETGRTTFFASRRTTPTVTRETAKAGSITCEGGAARDLHRI